MNFIATMATIAAACTIAAGANKDWTKAHTAADAGDTTTLSRLLKWQPKLASARDVGDHTPLHLAAFSGHKGAAEILLDSGADINARDVCGWTPLHTAIAQNHPEVMKLLLARGANVNAIDHHDQTPLQLALRHKRAPLAKLLREHGARD